MKDNTKGNRLHSKRGFIIDQTRKINQLINEAKIHQAEKIVEELLIEYPYDFGLFEIKARIHSLLGEYSEALYWLNKCDEKYIFLKKTIVAIKLNDYKLLKDLYEKYFKNKTYDDDFAMKIPNSFIAFQTLKIYLKKLFEPEKLKDYKSDIYVIKQTLNYNFESAMEHVLTRHSSTSQNDSSYFSEDFDITYWMPIIKRTIEENKDKARVSNYQEEYVFHFNNCGYDSDNKSVNYILVATVYNTSDIITMYPFKPNFEYSIIELIKPEEQKDIKVKKLSQSEKFNKRYGIN